MGSVLIDEISVRVVLNDIPGRVEPVESTGRSAGADQSPSVALFLTSNRRPDFPARGDRRPSS